VTAVPVTASELDFENAGFDETPSVPEAVATLFWIPARGRIKLLGRVRGTTDAVKIPLYEANVLPSCLESCFGELSGSVLGEDKGERTLAVDRVDTIRSGLTLAVDSIMQAASKVSIGN
jgi:hypothetical protein